MVRVPLMSMETLFPIAGTLETAAMEVATVHHIHTVLRESIKLPSL